MDKQTRTKIQTRHDDHAIVRKNDDSLIFCTNEYGEIVSHTVKGSKIVVVDPNDRTYPLLVFETESVSTEFRTSDDGYVQVRYEDPSYDFDLSQGYPAGEWKNVYVLVSGSIPDDFEEILRRPEQPSVAGSFPGTVGDDRGLKSRGNRRLYLQHGSRDVPANMRRVLPDGFQEGIPPVAATSLLVSSDGNIFTIAISSSARDSEASHSIAGATNFHVPADEWIRVSGLDDFQYTGNDVAVREEAGPAGTGKYLRFWGATSSAIIASSVQNHATLTLLTGGHRDEISKKRIVRDADAGGNMLFYYEATSPAVADGVPALAIPLDSLRFREVVRRLGPQVVEGHKVPYMDAYISKDSILSNDGAGNLLIDGVLAYYADIPVLNDGLAAPQNSDTTPAATSFSKVAVDREAGEYIITYHFEHVPVTLQRTFIVESTAAEEAEEVFQRLALRDGLSVTERRRAIEGSMDPPHTARSVADKIKFRKTIMKEALRDPTAPVDTRLARSKIFVSSEREGGIPAAILDKAEISVHAVGQISAGSVTKETLKAKAAEIREDFTSRRFPTDTYWPLSAKGDCFAARLIHSEGHAVDVIFRIKEDTETHVTYAVQVGDEDEHTYDPQPHGAIVRQTVQLGLRQYHFFLGGALSDGMTVLGGRTSWERHVVKAVDAVTVYQQVFIAEEFGSGAAFGPDVVYATGDFNEPWSDIPDDVTVNRDGLDLDNAGTYSVVYSRGGDAVERERTVIVPFTHTLEDVYAPSDVAEWNNISDFSVNAHVRTRVRSDTLTFAAFDDSNILIRPKESRTGQPSIIIEKQQ